MDTNAEIEGTKTEVKKWKEYQMGNTRKRFERKQ
jgi:hypothetical protein